MTTDTAAVGGSAERGGEADAHRTSRPESRWSSRLFVASVVAAAVPVVVAATRALGRHWIPLGDDGFFAVRSLDVFGHNIPLLGTWSSSSLSYRMNLNNPGPLLFDALAVPVKVLGANAGVPIGSALVNLAAIVGLAVFAHRRGGARLGSLAMVAAAALAWAMGSELLYEPWQPHILLLPMVLFAVLAWSVACGDLVALPVAAFVGSFLLETHLTYSVLVPALGVFALVTLLLGLRGERRRQPDQWPPRRRHAQRMGALAVAVLVAAWVQSFLEELTSSGPGNLTRIVRAARNTQVHAVGYKLAARLTASVLSLPPFWFRPSVQHTFYLDWHAPSLGAALVSLGLLVAVLGWCGWDSRRRRDRVTALAAATAAVAVVAALVTAAQSPITGFGTYTPHGLRFLWPVAAFVFFAVAATLAARLPGDGRRSDGLIGGFLLVTVVLGALNLPYANLGDGPNSQQWAIPAERQIQGQLGAVTGQGPVLVDDLFRTFADPYGSAVLVELQRRGVSFVARDDALVRQLGPDRRFTGHNAAVALLMRTGDATRTTPPGSHRVAVGEGLSRRDQHELDTLKTEIGGYLHRLGLPLNQRGEQAAQRGVFSSLPRPPSGRGPGLDPDPLLQSRDLVTMIDNHDLVLDGTWGPRFARYAELQHQWDRETVALFLGPVQDVAQLPIPAGRR